MLCRGQKGPYGANLVGYPFACGNNRLSLSAYNPGDGGMLVIDAAVNAPNSPAFALPEGLPPPNVL